MTDTVLTLNAGSSSLKFGLYRLRGGTADPAPLADGHVDGLGSAPHLRIVETGAAHALDHRLPAGADHGAILRLVLDWIARHEDGLRLVAAGHRVVHGGPAFTRPVVVTPETLTRLDALTPLAPLHQPHNLAPIRALAEAAPNLPQVACFDTAFHAGNAPVATHFALPRELTGAGIRRYGFHGLSYEYIASRLPDILGPVAGGRVVVAHLGNGASMCAMKDRRSVASTMGFTALDGLPMGTRSGAIDPGVLLYLMKEKGMGYEALSRLLYRESGLLGVSGISNDMRTLLASDAPEAREAVEIFTYRITRELGSLAAALGGLDALVFTGGIGEHAAPVREAVCRAADWLGLRFNPAANDAGAHCLSSAGSAVAVWVIPTDEDLTIARHTARVVGGPVGEAAGTDER
ncbi:acetate/propionate family kinase [Acidimangrovimonas sediminis]|uniref:acetate/propionate family kinase n=1 Tax=Acidimangrovimonas sediminis TaxID=2056283 RepID=UPI000C80DD55|nr:acetate/propionate family kinase [Acidimangrovimonas sediminis]